MSDFISIIAWHSILASLQDPKQAISVIVAPNFEERSNAVLFACCENLIGAQLNNRWHIITLQGQNEYDARDYIKARNCNRAYEALVSSGLRDGVDLFSMEMMNPTNDEELRSLLGSSTDGMDNDFTLVIDASSIPRAFLWSLLSALSSAREATMGFRKPRKIWLVYAWAKDYPETLEYETTGRIVDSVSARPLDLTVETAKSLDAMIFTSGNTRNAFMAVDSFVRAAHKKDFFVEVVHFVRPMGFSRSWHHLKLHQELLAKKPSTDRIGNSFVFHIEHALAWIRTLADKAFHKLKDRGDHRFIIAPNGPKIVSILSQYVADEYIWRITQDPDLVKRLNRMGLSPKDCVSVLSTKGSQFLSVYSLGIDGEISCAEVTV